MGVFWTSVAPVLVAVTTISCKPAVSSAELDGVVSCAPAVPERVTIANAPISATDFEWTIPAPHVQPYFSTVFATVTQVGSSCALLFRLDVLANVAQGFHGGERYKGDVRLAESVRWGGVLPNASLRQWIEWRWRLGAAVRRIERRQLQTELRRRRSPVNRSRSDRGSLRI